MEQSQDLTRRDFVKAAGTATVVASAVAGPAIIKAYGAEAAVPFASIGTGSRGTYLLRHMAAGVPNGRCVAVCDVYEPNLKTGQKDAGTNPQMYKDYREVLDRKDIQAVVIATPLYLHYPVTRDALLAGKHVFCEKSLVFLPEEIHALRALANERPKQVLQVGLQRRYSKFYQAAKQMIEKKLIGQLTHIQAQWHRNTFAKDPWNKPLPNDRTDKEVNWRKYRNMSGGLTAELGSHQIDVADWMFGSVPEFIVGVGGTNFIKDGRDIFDNIQLIYQYPKGQKLVYTSITTNRHLALFGGTRNEFGECFMGTEGTIEITVGTDTEPAIALWYPEPKPATTTAAPASKDVAIAGASLASTGKGSKAFPILLDQDQIRDNDSFLAKELKFARRWLYSKGVMMPEEDRNPVDVEMESFFNDCRTGKRPLADLEVGLADSTTVILANKAMDEGRRIYFNEMDKMGLPGSTPAKNAQNGRPLS
jgi:predicted dehydrogenase